MKTICFVVAGFPKPTQTFVVNQIVEAKKNGFSVKILTKRIENIKNSSQEKFIQENKLLENIIVEKYDIPKFKFIRRLKASFLIAKYYGYWNLLKADEKNYRKRFSELPFKIEFYANLKQIDLFHIQFAVAGINLAKMKAIGLIKAKLITTFHGYDAHYKDDNELESLQSRYKTLLRFSDYITVNTPYLEKNVQKLGTDTKKIVVIPMGIDINFFQKNSRAEFSFKNQINLLSIGRLIEFKGFHYAIHAVKQLVERGFNIEYTIVGEGKLKTELESLISNLKLEDSIFLVGRKTQYEIRDLFYSNDIYLMSSIIDSTGRGETQGVVTAEAQAAGLPVIAFNCGGVPYTIASEKTGYLVDEKDIEKYAESIASLINNAVLYNKMSCAAVNFARQNFSNKIMGECFLKLYNN